MLTKIRKVASNVLGWRTNRKLIVIESDDWGSVRTRDKEALQFLSKKNFDVEQSNFVQYDSLERAYDLECLFDVLSSVKDKNGKSAVFTPMSIMGNPDFQSIKESRFEEFVIEPFTETGTRYAGSENLLGTLKDGIDQGIWQPEYHGREHLNHLRWMRGLRDGDKGLTLPFEVESFGLSKVDRKAIRDHLAAYDPEFQSDIPLLEKSLIDGIAMFQSIFGRQAQYFVASKSPEPKAFEEALADNGIKYLTRYKLQRYPLGDGLFQKELNWLGKRNDHAQIVITRNATFEPSENPHFDWVDNCLNDIRLAFQLNKPAVISSHRVNFVGRLSEKNQSSGLKTLETLLKQIVKRWPDVEFVSSSELGNLISSK